MVDGSDPGDVVEPTQAVSLLSAAIGREFVLVGRLAGGETGATEVRGVGVGRFVLKWELDPDKQQQRRRGVELAARLRTEAGWPCPEQQTVETEGLMLVLQAFLPGADVDHLSHDLVDTLDALHDQRLGLAPGDDEDRWGHDMIEILVDGGNGYCLHEPLRTFDPRTRRVVDRIEEIGLSLSPADISGGDVVHGDLHPGATCCKSPVGSARSSTWTTPASATPSSI